MSPLSAERTAELYDLTDAAETRKRANGKPAQPKQSIDVTECDLSDLTRQSIAALEIANHPPVLFRQKGIPCRVDPDEDGQPHIRALNVPRMRFAMSAASDFSKRQKKKIGSVAVSPPRDLVENVHCAPDLPFPGLRGIARAPFFNADGQMIKDQGYDAGSQLYLAMDESLVIPSVPARPTAAYVTAALACIADIFADFPFKGKADRAHAFAMLLLPFVRELVHGPTPLHLVGAPAAGTGKTLLSQAGLFPGCGRVAVSVFGRDDEEQRKFITTVIMHGASAVLLDNLKGRIDSKQLAAVLTADTWKDRALGGNSEIELPNRAVWCATSNNARLTYEITRRTISIRLDADVEKPAEREQQWRHADLLAYLERNRGKFIAAALTVVQAWVVAGQPGCSKRMGSFESWASVVGGILFFAGIDGFLENAAELAEAADDESDTFGQFVANWADTHGESVVSPTDLLPLAMQSGAVESDAKQPSASLGHLLAQNVDAVFYGYKVQKLKRNNAFQPWRLKQKV